MDHTLYLDYDGVLHPADVRATIDEPDRPRVYVRGEPTDAPLFEHVDLLERLLEPFPLVAIILATSWVRMFSYAKPRSRSAPCLNEGPQ